jgi:prepilin-type N-terminal cleavage/methylation domain-containing protein
MVSERIRTLSGAGFTLIELIVVVAITGVLVAVGAPFLTTYYQARVLRAGTDELFTILNSARYQAIKQNTPICVSLSANTVQYRVGGCGGAVWTGAGTNSAGFITLQNTMQVSAATASVIFTNLGAASTAGTYTVRNPANGNTLTVTVAGSGRITIP